MPLKWVTSRALHPENNVNLANSKSDSDAAMIRPACLEDRTNIAALLIQVWLHTYARDGLRDPISRYVLAEFMPEKVGADMQAPGKTYLVAEKNRHIVGLAVLDMAAACPVTGQRMPALHKLYVQEHFTGQGIGKMLLDEVIEKCVKSDAEKLWLTVSPRNPGAVQFYERHRFFYVGKTIFELEEERHENHVLHRRINSLTGIETQ